MADVGRLSGHDCLRGLAGGLIDVVYCARTDESFKFDAMVPKDLRRSSLKHFSRGTALQLPDAAFSSIHPWRVGFGLSSMAVCFFKFPGKVSFSLLIRSVHDHNRRDAITLEQ